MFGSALLAATQRGVEVIVKFLLEKGADINTQGEQYGSALQAAAWNGDELIMQLLEKGADVKAKGGLNVNALQAVAWGDKELVKLFIKMGTEIIMQGGLHGGALMAALINRHLDVASSLTTRTDFTMQEAGIEMRRVAKWWTVACGDGDGRQGRALQHTSHFERNYHTVILTAVRIRLSVLEKLCFPRREKSPL